MDIHENARLTPFGRERLAKMILGGQTPEAASEAAGVCPRTGRKWRDRFEQEGLAGLQDSGIILQGPLTQLPTRQTWRRARARLITGSGSGSSLDLHTRRYRPARRFVALPGDRSCEHHPRQPKPD